MITLDVEDGIVSEDVALSEAVYLKIQEAFATQFRDVVGVIGVSYVDDTEIRRLNRLYRGKDAVTDVLSFASEHVEQTGALGDVVIAINQALRQAKDDDISLELVDLIVHGMLHVLGYDHEVAEDAARMFPLQDLLVATIL